MYRDILTQQVNMKNSLTSKFGTMTQAEKKFNKQNLNAYKSYDNQNYSMVPGVPHNLLAKVNSGNVSQYSRFKHMQTNASQIAINRSVVIESPMHEYS